MLSHRLPLAIHTQLGQDLARSRDAVQAMILMLAPVQYFGKAGPHIRLAYRLERAIDTGRAYLDDQLCQEYPADATPHHYYPTDRESYPRFVHPLHGVRTKLPLTYDGFLWLAAALDTACSTLLPCGKTVLPAYGARSRLGRWAERYCMGPHPLGHLRRLCANTIWDHYRFPDTYTILLPWNRRA